MKKLLITLLIGLISLGSFAQKQKNNKPVIIYSLPKTILLVKVEVKEIKEEVGPYYRYAERFLGLKDVITENKTNYEVEKVEIHRKGIADENRTYQVQNGFISLNKRGVICGINTGSKKSCKKEKTKCKRENKSYANFIANTVLTEDQLVANSTAKMAENAAKQIYRIRENRINLISGESERTPADGKSLKVMLKKLDQTEKALLTLFTGKSIIKILKEEYRITPDKNLEKYVLFRISALNGIVDKDDLSGSPVYLNASYTKNATPPAKIKKGNGYFYNLPGIANISVYSEEKEFLNKELEISQHGSLQKLPCKVTKKNSKVKYDNKSGAILSIEKE